MLFYLVGYPVSHSMSAVMHNAAFKALRLNHRYVLLDVKPEELKKACLKIRADEQACGANITIPHKTEIMKYLNEIDHEALRIGAVNTMKKTESGLKGFNTDGIGALRALQESYGNIGDAKIVVIGAGGASRAICYKLAVNAFEVIILNRTAEHAVSLSNYLSSLPECKAHLSAGSLHHDILSEALNDSDILVNATSVGMYPITDSTVIEPKYLNKGLLVFDSVYNPIQTKLIRDASTVGARTLTGINMLVYQGSAAFELWLGKKAPESIMMRAVVEALERKLE